MASMPQFNTVAVSGSDTHGTVAASSNPVQIMGASQEQRAWGSIFNDSAQSLYLKFGNDLLVGITGSTQVFDVKVTSGSLYELKQPIYQGEIWGCWDGTPAGYARTLQLGVPTGIYYGN